MDHIGVKLTYLLDGSSVSTLLAGIITGSAILALLGGLASIAAFINHAQQIIERKRNKKK